VDINKQAERIIQLENEKQ